MKVEVCSDSSGVTKVWYYPNHSHKIYVADIQHHPMSAETSKYTSIQEQITTITTPIDNVQNVCIKAFKYLHLSSKANDL